MTKEQLDKMTLEQIRSYPEQGEAFIELLKDDRRKGVRQYAEKLEKKARIYKEDIQKAKIKKDVDNSVRDLGFDVLCGIDEVGRGALAGPVYAAAVILSEESLIPGVDDSKRMGGGKRVQLAKEIEKDAIAYAIGSVDPERIDEVNIYNATKEAMISAVEQLEEEPDFLLVDSMKLDIGKEELNLVRGDNISYVIGAASILAKVQRDEFMKKMDELYPEYNFKKNKGYGTKDHIDAIKKYGLTPIHRKSFCKKFIEPDSDKKE